MKLGRQQKEVDYGRKAKQRQSQYLEDYDCGASEEIEISKREEMQGCSKDDCWEGVEWVDAAEWRGLYWMCLLEYSA